MSQFLPLPILSDTDNTPPIISPTKIPETMLWLKRTPTTAPLPASPTKSRNSSDHDSESVSSPGSSDLAQLPKSLRNKSATFPLQRPTSTSPLPSQPASEGPYPSPSRWLFRLSRTLPSTLAAVDKRPEHFLRSSPTALETQARLSRRRAAAEQRVGRMREYLGSHVPAATSQDVDASLVGIDKTESPIRMHHRIDSASSTTQALQKIDIATPETLSGQAPAPEWNPLAYCILPKPHLDIRGFNCIGCRLSHKTSLYDSRAVVWMLHGCRHLVHDACFDKLRDCGSERGFVAGGCWCCEAMVRMVGGWGVEDVDRRHERLLEGVRRG